MNFKSIFASNIFLKSIFVVSLFILIFISAINYRHTVVLSDSTKAMVHSHEVYLELEQLRSFIKDAEIGQRGFIITRDTVFLQPFSNARKKVNRSFKILKRLTIENDQQQQSLDSLLHLINQHFAFLDISLKLSSQAAVDKFLLDRTLLRSKKIMDKIRFQINQMIDLEMANLKERQKKYENEISFTPIFTLMLLLFSLLIFIFSYFRINQDLDILKKSNQELVIKTKSFQHAEKIGDFGISEWDLETNGLCYSDNLYKLLGCRPQSFEPTVENYLKFVHPDDRHIVATGADDVVENVKTYARSYRIIRQDGELRYFKSLGKFISDGEKNKMHIGIIKDVTEAHLSEIALEDKNLELERNINELDSFNHVASHDLQEPLRKIQLFISRINEKDRQAMSETGRGYLEKIQAAAQRMRTLIDDLLMFSSINKSEKVFELSDLNLLLENAKQELTELIEEKKATITFLPLPTLNAIPFQIQQLLINLIGNSLKYSKPNIAPIIDITCEKTTAKDYPMLKADEKKVFYKIAITDNGLGFDQQYAESIFTVFHRLHHSTQYSGTGIGLSICKKIVENHGGFIVAEGKPDTGATFTMFLPE